MWRLYLIGLAVAIALAIGCSSNDPIQGQPPDPGMTCPPDISVPGNCAHPDSLGGYPDIVGYCMDQPRLSYRDSIPPGSSGGIKRIWIASDTCGNADTCIQSIGLGAPGPCD